MTPADPALDPGPARPRRQGAARLERDDARGADRGRRRARPGRLDGAVARANARFLLTGLRREDGRLLRSWRAPYLAYAEDYAALLEALCTLAELDDASWLDFARPVADELLRLFHDDERGGFFTTGTTRSSSSCG